MGNPSLRRGPGGLAAVLLPALVLALLAAPVHAATVDGFQLQRHGDATRVEFAVPANLRYRVFTLSDPARVVLDLHNAKLADDAHPSAGSDPLIREIRWAPRFHGRGERLVFDLARDAVPRSFLHRDGGDHAQLVLQLTARTDAAGTAGHAGAAPVAAASTVHAQQLRDVVVAIDPGHGGHDSGAVGPDGLKEKTVTLAIARDLRRRLAKVKGIRPILTRAGDHFVTLAGRRRIAHRHHADLFISIHADSSPYHYPKGSTVYVLSQHGASSVAARILAASENSADRVAGVNLADEQPVVRSTILKLSQSGTIAQSMLLARRVMGKVNSVVPLHSDTVERAAFVVLKSPDIPSILVETAFISNRHEEHQLGSRGFRSKLAAAIARGVERYVDRFAPPGTLIAARRNALYVLKQG